MTRRAWQRAHTLESARPLGAMAVRACAEDDEHAQRARLSAFECAACFEV